MIARRRIGVFLNDMHSLGGIQRVAANLARDLQSWYDVHLITVFSAVNRFDQPGIAFETLRLPYQPGRFYPRYREMPIIAARLRKVVNNSGIDTIICFWFHLASIAAVSLPKQVKTIGYEHIAFAGAIGRWAKIRKWCYPWLDAVVSLSQEDRGQFAALSKTVRVIPNYVDIPPAVPNEHRERILLAVGHIEHRKGIDRLLWALKGPLSAHSDWRLVIVGGGDSGSVEHWYLSYIQDLAALLRIAPQVELHAGTSRIWEWYARASIYVMGSRLEGFPMVLLEAKAHGLPIVSYDCPTGPKEIVRHNLDGFLVGNDPSEFAASAYKLMQDSELRRRMGAAALDDVATRFSPERVCPQWHSLIEELHRAPS